MSIRIVLLSLFSGLLLFTAACGDATQRSDSRATAAARAEQTAEAQEPGDTYFEVTGDYETMVSNAGHLLEINSFTEGWQMNLYNPERGVHEAILFLFTSSFKPEPGTYGIGVGSDVLTSFTAGEAGQYSDDAKGEMVIEELGERIRGTFSFTSGHLEEEGSEVQVKGAFDVERGEAFGS